MNVNCLQTRVVTVEFLDIPSIVLTFKSIAAKVAGGNDASKSMQQILGDTIALATRFFDAIENGDIASLRQIYAVDAVIWHNTDEAENTVEQNVRVLTDFVKRIRHRRYENRRLEVFPGGFVQQHVLTGTRPDGVHLKLPACLVCKVANGRITRLDEYFDSAAVAPWLTAP